MGLAKNRESLSGEHNVFLLFHRVFSQVASLCISAPEGRIVTGAIERGIALRAPILHVCAALWQTLRIWRGSGVAQGSVAGVNRRWGVIIRLDGLDALGGAVRSASCAAEFAARGVAMHILPWLSRTR